MFQKRQKITQVETTKYYDKFSNLYDFLSPKSYYHKARKRAVDEMRLKQGMNVLNVPVGTGQSFEYFQDYLMNTGTILGADISEGMLSKAQKKIKANSWENIDYIKCDVLDLKKIIENTNELSGFDAILCDLGLSGFPNWKKVIDDLVSLLNPRGRISIMDWYIPQPSLRGEFVKWIGKGEVNRPIWQYLETKVSEFSVESSFNRSGVFVASGAKSENHT
ncbi:MAG: class I SAM-dependent methyltransferase [Gallionella sp.]